MTIQCFLLLKMFHIYDLLLAEYIREMVQILEVAIG